MRRCALNQFTEGPNGVERVNKKWEAAADIVNPLGNCKKKGRKWKEALSKLKTRAKAAYNDRITYIKGTGGGVSADLAALGLGIVHTKCLTLMNRVSITGNSDVPLPLEVNEIQRKTPGYVDRSRNDSTTGYSADYRRDFSNENSRRNELRRGTTQSPGAGAQSVNNQWRSSVHGFADDWKAPVNTNPSTNWRSPTAYTAKSTTQWKSPKDVKSSPKCWSPSQRKSSWHTSTSSSRAGRFTGKEWTSPSPTKNLRHETPRKWKQEVESEIYLSDSPLTPVYDTRRERTSTKRSPESTVGPPKKKLSFGTEGSPSANVHGSRAGGGIDSQVLTRFNTAIDSLVASVNLLQEATQRNSIAVTALSSLQESVDANTTAVAALKDSIVQQLP